MDDLQEYLESQIAKKIETAEKSNDLLTERMRTYQKQTSTKATSEDAAFFITHHRNFVELLTLTTLYCQNFPEGLYTRSSLQKRANEWVRTSETNLIRMLELGQ